MKEINLRLREIRRSRNLSQEELAEKLGVSRQAIIALEQGASLPSLPVLLALMRVLDLPFSHLFEDQWQPFRPQTDKANSERSDLSFFNTSDHASIPISIHESSEFIQLNALLGGIKEEDITIDLSQQHVLIMATRKAPYTQTDNVHLNEIEVGPLARIVGLPCPIDTQKAQAQFTNGILQLTLPKFLPTLKRRITFNSDTKRKQVIEEA